MNSIQFYPTLTDELLQQSQCSIGKYALSYIYNGSEIQLSADIDKDFYQIKDISDPWTIENDGLSISRTVIFEKTDALFGASGIACSGATLGVCIKWRNPGTTTMGVILPETEENDSDGYFAEFSYVFPAGTISGNIILSAELFIKSSAPTVRPEEKHLMNDVGVSVGIMDETVIGAKNDYMVFPIEEVNDPSAPLWWVFFSDWDDPTIDMFCPDNICLYLNNAHSACPKVSDRIFNPELLADILAQVYCMMIKRIREEDMNRIIRGDELTDNSIGHVLNHFLSNCPCEVHPKAAPEVLTKELLANISSILSGGSNT